jgi:hypothetical protein
MRKMKDLNINLQFLLPKTERVLRKMLPDIVKFINYQNTEELNHKSSVSKYL